MAEKLSEYESPYSLQHPVKTAYSAMIQALWKAGGYQTMIGQGLGEPGEGKEMHMKMWDELINANRLQGEIVGGWFKDKDLESVYPGYEKPSLVRMVSGERPSLDLLNQRQIKIKAVCEREHWFEDEGHRLTAEEIPEA